MVRVENSEDMTAEPLTVSVREEVSVHFEQVDEVHSPAGVQLLELLIYFDDGFLVELCVHFQEVYIFISQFRPPDKTSHF